MLLVGCSHASNTTYSGSDVGRTIETSEASVVASRIVNVTGETNALGPVAGGAAAAVTTGAFVGGKNAGLLAALAGLVGAGAGYVAQQQFNDREGIEYVLKMDDGRTVTLVQNRGDDELPIPNGTPVLVQISGQYTRIITDPRVDGASAGGGDWVNPDAGGSRAAPSADAGGASSEPSAAAGGDAAVATAQAPASEVQ